MAKKKVKLIKEEERKYKGKKKVGEVGRRKGERIKRERGEGRAWVKKKRRKRGRGKD